MLVSLFDVAGPIMVGPSSSHTAGACKIGQIARALFNGTPQEVIFYLYGSFGTVYQGHATDRALLAGVMKLQTSDPKLKDAFRIAQQKDIRYKFIPITTPTPEHHPNTVRIILKKGSRHLSVVGSSLGGGKVQITHINLVPIDLEMVAGRFFSLIVGHGSGKTGRDAIKSRLKEWGIAVHDEQTFSTEKGRKLSPGKRKELTVFNIEEKALRLPQVLELERLPGVEFVRALTKLLK